jgi:tetratricopeptide (TPR) repeat protein
MLDQFAHRREQAKALHQRGEYLQAQAAYQEILIHNNEDADTLGLLALCKFQMGDHNSAFSIWGRVNSIPAVCRIVWRNCNNALSAALSAATHPNVQSLLSGIIPNWDVEVTPADISLAQSFLIALESFDLGKDVDRLLSSFIAQLNASSGEGLVFLRWALDKNYSANLGSMIGERLDHVDNPDTEVQLLRGSCFFITGDIAKSEAIAERVARAAPIYLTQASDSQKFVIAVLNRPSPAVVRPISLAEFHFSENTPSSLVKQFSQELRLLSYFPNAEAIRQIGKLDVKPTVVLNNWATAEILAIPGVQETVNEALESLNVPILNSPDKVVLTTRQRNAQNLKDIEGLLVPKIVRFENRPGTEISNAIMLEEEIGYPLILREPFQQMGKETEKIESTNTLLAALAGLGAGQFYAIAFVDNPLAPSLYRKFRAAVIGQNIFITHVHFGADWNVHRIRNEELRQKIETRVRQIPAAQYLLNKPNSEVNRAVFHTLGKLRARIPLEMFGVDFDVMADGKVLFFEANSAMNISFSEAGGNADIRSNMKAAFLDLVVEVSRTSGKSH